MAAKSKRLNSNSKMTFPPAMGMVAIEEDPEWVAPAAVRSQAARSGLKTCRMLWWA